MHSLRSVIAGAIALAITAVLPLATATALPLSPPYNAFVLDGGTGSYLLTGVRAYDATTATITASESGDGFGAHMSAANFWWFVSFQPPIGSTITVGTTYPTLRFGRDETHGFMDVGGDGRGCNYQSGFMTVNELTRAPGTNTITSLAANFSTSCENDVQVFWGDVRFNSNIAVAATIPSPSSVDFGDEPVGSPGQESTVTYAAAGSADSVPGAASIVNGNMFTITGNTCSNTTVAAGSTCTIRVRANATAIGAQSASLKLLVNSGSGAVYVPLTLNGIDGRSLTATPSSLNFGSGIVGRDTAPMSTTLTATGVVPITLGTVALAAGGSPESFRITGGNCSNVTLQPGQSCTITVVGHPSGIGFRNGAIAVPNNSVSNPLFVELQVYGDVINTGTYYPLLPSRILDTREGNGAPRAPVGPAGVVHLQVEGRGGVPTFGVSAVVLNVTVTAPTTAGHITVWPAGVAMPTASSLNFVPGWTGANSVTVAVGANGMVDLFNSAGNTHLIADVVGFYTKDNSLVHRGLGGEFQPVIPERLFDSRSDWGFQLPAGAWLELPISYGSTYDPHIRALAVNITAVNGRGNGFLTAFNAQGTPPPTSTLNFSLNTTVPNFAIVPTGTCFDCGEGTFPMIGVYTSVDVDVIVDIIGFYDDGQLADGTHDGLRFTPRTPLRITDSRIGQGMPGALGQAATVSLEAPAASLPPATEALALNVTAVTPTVNTFISIWPTGLPQPTISTLNPSAGAIVPNATAVLLGNGNRFNVYNNGGSTHLVIDMVGTFYFLPALNASGPSLAFKRADGEVPGATRGNTNGLKITKIPAQMHR